MAWERGIGRVKQRALQFMKDDHGEMGINPPEDGYDFKAAMVLSASHFVGPYPDRVATFLRYPLGFVTGNIRSPD